jgi:hypothetical protein
MTDPLKKILDALIQQKPRIPTNATKERSYSEGSASSMSSSKAMSKPLNELSFASSLIASLEKEQKGKEESQIESMIQCTTSFF